MTDDPIAVDPGDDARKFIENTRRMSKGKAHLMISDIAIKVNARDAAILEALTDISLLSNGDWPQGPVDDLIKRIEGGGS